MSLMGAALLVALVGTLAPFRGIEQSYHICRPIARTHIRFNQLTFIMINWSSNSPILPV
jgi:hypothetical protein